MEKSFAYMNNIKNMPDALNTDPDRIFLMIHADDAGLSHAENRATIEALKHGSVNSYSIMVPCPWFYEMAEFSVQNPNFDCGIHLTLTCEWNSYKFGPVLGPKEVPSLVDNYGHFYRSRKEVLDNAELEDLKKELCAQIDKALLLGVKPSHLDSHMYSLGVSKEFLHVYREIGQRYELPVMLNSTLITEVSGFSASEIELKNEIIIDHIHLGNFEDFEKGGLAEYYASSLENLKPGINMILIHTAYDDLEMQAITKDHPNFGSSWRQIDLDFFTSEKCARIIKEQKVQMVTWKDLKESLYLKGSNDGK